MNLVKKPEWLSDKHPLGQTPALERDNFVVYDSIAVAKYLDETGGNPSLLRKTIEDRTKDDALLAILDAKVRRI